MVLAAAAYVRLQLRDPSIRFFAPEAGASWIRFPDPFLFLGRPASQEVSLFRTHFTIAGKSDRARLTVRAFKVVIVQVDRVTLAPARSDPNRWKEPVEVEIGPGLPAGAHELQLAVLAANGHACALAHSAELGLATGAGWEASHDGNAWAPAARVDEPVDLSREGPAVPSMAEALLHTGPWLVLIFLAAFAWSSLRSRGKFAALACTPLRVRWLLLAAWAVLAVNDLPKIPLDQGFDHGGHMDYVRYLLERGRLPLANEGWEMYQAPLAYVLAALLRSLTSAESLLRLLPLACGALQVEVAFRTLRRVFPDREDLQCIGIWIAGLLPANLYVSQVFSNEPLAAISSAVVAFLCVKALCDRSDERPWREAAWMGVALGVALLSKMTAIVWVPLAGAALLFGRERSRFARAGLAWGIAALISGWFYARNWIELGKPFVGNWDWRESNRIWWQDPGYRIPEHFLRFGRSLVRPVFAAFHGFWDAMYSTMWADGMLSGSWTPPPWKLDWMLAGVWLGLPITAAGLVALVRPSEPSGSSRSAQRFAALAVVAFWAVALAFYLRLPIYSCAKASYTLGLIPCYAILAAAGLAPLRKATWARAAIDGWLVASGAAFFAAYFVL
jgi:hypothetical protein